MKIKITLLLIAVFAISFASTERISFKTCQTSSTYSGHFPCTKAIDGVAGTCSDNTISISKFGKNWWRGVFSHKYRVTHVIIYNRASTFGLNRLANFDIFGDNGKPCAEYNHRTTFRHRKFVCNTVTTSITIKLKRSDFLELCEVIAYGTYQNEARAKKAVVPFVNCNQKQDYSRHFSCKYAMDLKTSQCAGHHALSITKISYNAWWEGIFNRKVRVTHVTIWNRVYTFSLNRLVNFKIITDSGHVCAEYKGTTTFFVKTFACNAVTASIKVQLNGRNYLELCEVKAYGAPIPEPKNILGFKTCQTSSTYANGRHGFQCNKAIDNKIGACHDSTVSITELDKNHWWRGNFGRKVHVKKVTIWNRANTKYLNRLVHFEILTDSGKRCASYPHGTTFSMKTFECDAITSSIVIVQRVKSYLELCEVRAYGDETPANEDKNFVPFSKCTQSGDYMRLKRYSCTKAMDGSTKPGQMSITPIIKNAWWKGNFDNKVQLSYVTIYNRISTFSLNRLVNFKIITDSGHVCAEYKKKTAFFIKTFVCNALTSSVRIQLNGRNYLELGEVKAFTNKPNPDDKLLTKDLPESKPKPIDSTFCVDNDTKQKYKIGDKWTNKNNGFCFFNVCRKGKVDSKTKCLSKQNKCIKPSEAGTDYACENGRSCSCVLEGGKVFIQHYE